MKASTGSSQSSAFHPYLPRRGCPIRVLQTPLLVTMIRPRNFLVVPFDQGFVSFDIHLPCYLSMHSEPLVL
eukprot:m.601692 g.601692  ORF g.601692 m.601692 type:complete len:71 (-) comp58091_c0_seq7:534-746(-)